MKVVNKQKNTKDCFICGLDNCYGLQAPFYEMEDGSVCTIFKFKSQHQSYPGRVHGGIITAMLDELAGRVYWIKDPNAFAVTTSLEVKFRKPVPYDVELKGIGYITKDTTRAYEAVATILTLDGDVLATATMKYMKLSAMQISGDSLNEESFVETENDRKVID